MGQGTAVNDADCAAQCAAAARRDVRRTLVRYFEMVAGETPARAAERADAMLTHFDHPATAPRPSTRAETATVRAGSARAELLNVMASWFLTTGRGSREIADRILNAHAHELAEKQRAAYPPEDYEVMRDATDLIDPEVTK
jgi:hypothetical protein